MNSLNLQQQHHPIARCVHAVCAQIIRRDLHQELDWPNENRDALMTSGLLSGLLVNPQLRNQYKRGSREPEHPSSTRSIIFWVDAHPWQVAVCCDSSVANQNVTSRTTLQIEVAAPLRTANFRVSHARMDVGLVRKCSFTRLLRARRPR